MLNFLWVGGKILGGKIEYDLKKFNPLEKYRKSVTYHYLNEHLSGLLH